MCFKIGCTDIQTSSELQTLSWLRTTIKLYEEMMSKRVKNDYLCHINQLTTFKELLEFRFKNRTFNIKKGKFPIY